MAKDTESNPAKNAVHVAQVQTKEEWELGMPPPARIDLSVNLWLTAAEVNNFKN
jgi:hypothetical protein